MAQSTEESLLHRVLVTSNQLQQLPPSAVAGSFVFDSGLVGIFWLERGAFSPALIAALGVLVASLINWGMLRRLPQAGRSFGPDQPVALALGAVEALAAVILALFGASIGLTLVVVALIAALAYYATWIEPFSLTLTRERFQAKGWHGSGAEGTCLRLLHLSDLHIERTTERERRVNAMIASLQPDLIVFSGDFVNLSYQDDPQAKKDIRAIIGAWRAPLGVYCVAGTPAVEPMPRVLEFVQGLDNLTLLANNWVTVETPCGALHILGLITTHNLESDREALAKMMSSAPEGTSPDGIKLLLVHSPDLALEAADAGIDLYLCGHTHGGQIRVPVLGALVSATQAGKRFVMGRHQVGAMTLYTSRGIGMEGLGAPRARFLCAPEVILWEISAP